MIISGVSAAYITADAEVPNKRPDSKAGPRMKKLMWEDATQEQRDNLMWFKTMLGTYTLLSHTKEEEHEIWLDKQYHLQEMLKYILKHNGLDTYFKVYNFYKDRFDEYQVTVDNEFPHCKYADGQCDLFCKYYKSGNCWYETRLDQTVTAM